MKRMPRPSWDLPDKVRFPKPGDEIVRYIRGPKHTYSVKGVVIGVWVNGALEVKWEDKKILMKGRE